MEIAWIKFALFGQKELKKKLSFKNGHRDPVWEKEKTKDIASVQIATGGERRHAMCFGARSGIEPKTFGY